MSTRLALIAALSLPLVACGGRQPEPHLPAEISESPTEEESGIRRSAMSRGIEAAEAGRFRAAVGWFDEAVARGEDPAEAFLNRAIVYAAQGLWEQAVSDAQLAVEQGGGDDARLVLVGIQVRAGLVDAAESDLRSLQERSDDARVLNAVALATRGLYAEAQEALQGFEATELGAGALNTLGIVAEGLGDFDAAADFFNRAIGADDQACEPWRNLGMLLMRQGQDVAAVRALERYLALAPREAADRGVIEGRIAALND